MNKALVTQASSAIPVVPLYLSILYRIMKEMGLHEGCIEQIERLFRTELFTKQPNIDGYWEDFYHMFGFRYDTIDYQEDIEV